MNNEIIKLQAELERVRSTLQVIDGTWCQENRSQGKEPCGLCIWCTRDQYIELWEQAEALNKTAKPKTLLDKPFWFNSYVCPQCKAKLYKNQVHKMSCYR